MFSSSIEGCGLEVTAIAGVCMMGVEIVDKCCLPSR